MIKKSKIYIFLTIVVLLIVIRLLLPGVVLYYANSSLANMKGYYGHIKDIDLALFRGAYKIDSVYLNKVDSVSAKQTPFFAASVIDLSVEWQALFNGHLVGEVIFENPVMVFTKDKVEPGTLKKDSADLIRLLDTFMPLQVNRLKMTNGSIHYIDESTIPLVDISMTNTTLLAENLTNSYDSTTILPAKISATADIYGGGLSLNMRLNPLAEYATFDLNAELKDTNLVALNNLFQAYAKIDVNKGTFGMYAEIAANDGKFIGYVKPLIKDLDILGKEDRSDNIFRQMWEGTVGGLAQVVENNETDKIATKIMFEGSLENPDTNVWYAIATVLRNAFIQAIQPAIDNEINITSVDGAETDKQNLFQKIFRKKYKKKQAKK